MKYFINVIFLISFFFICNPLTAQQNVENCFILAIENNSQILSAKADYDSKKLLSQNNGTLFTPELIISGSKNSQNNYSSELSYNQPLPGGASLRIISAYDYSLVKIDNSKIKSQYQSISISINQSLFPFWLKGQLTDPNIISYKLQEEYYYNNLIYTQKNILQDLLQYCVEVSSEYNRMKALNNSIQLVQLQKNALLELIQTGGTNEAKLIELETLQWSYEQDLLEIKSNIYSLIQKIKSLCGDKCDWLTEESLIDLIPSDYTPEDFINFFNKIIDNQNDPYEKALLLKIQILENNNTSIAQNSAPLFGISASLPFDLNNKKIDDWSLGLSLDFSPLFSSLLEHKKNINSIDIQTAKNDYNSYLKQREFLREQYNTLVIHYDEQLQAIDKLLSKYTSQLQDTAFQYKEGAISKLDYESEKLRFENSYLTYKNIFILSWYYKILSNLLY